jgi:hypothetical protein|tara:strand:+ start:626 stop:760 length:135 start_codon:yes stop_codon:yes gene_type:complete
MVSRYEKNLRRVELSKTKKEKKAEAKAAKEEEKKETPKKSQLAE